jgi:hypothetical protein
MLRSVGQPGTCTTSMDLRDIPASLNTSSDNPAPGTVDNTTSPDVRYRTCNIISVGSGFYYETIG